MTSQRDPCPSDNGWRLVRRARDPREDKYYETLFALTNGRIGLRATVDFEETESQPGFFHFDAYGPGLTVPSHVINLFNPGWWRLYVGGAPLVPTRCGVVEFSQSLDLYRATTQWSAVLTDVEGRRTRVSRQWFLPGSRAETIATRTILEPLNHDAPIAFAAGFDWRDGNGDFGGMHPNVRLKCLVVDEAHAEGKRIGVSGAINGADRRVWGTMALRSDGVASELVERDIAGIMVRLDGPGVIDTLATVSCEPISNRLASAAFDDLQQDHEAIWAGRWACATTLRGPMRDVVGLRFAQFQMLQCLDRQRPSTNVAARGLTSEYHSGHFFFNTELYLGPWLALVEPRTAKALLRFRIETLGEAEQFARRSGFVGARFPEEADRQGRPAAPSTIRDPFTGETSREWSGELVFHLSACVLYSLAVYLRMTGDAEFFARECIPLVARTSTYLADLVRLDPKVGARGARSVMCFDEFHYPVDHHVGTNGLAKWALGWSAGALDRLEQTDPSRASEMDALGAGSAARALWRQRSSEIYLPAADSQGVFPVFEGYFDLPDRVRLDDPSGGLPRLSDEQEESANRLEPFTTRLTKQADVLMLLTLLPQFAGPAAIGTNLAYYEPRTVHGSSLSLAPHAVAAGWSGQAELLRTLLVQSARYDLDFSPRLDYRNGIHFGACAGALIALVYGACGLSGKGRVLEIRPCMPAAWEEIEVHLFWKDCDLKLIVGRDSVVIEHRGGGELQVSFDGALTKIQSGSTTRLPLRPVPATAQHREST
ncbi:MAG: glycosyl hydrolase family 65 protein [Alphaproteobacteria bacterium]|nr:glycosyl hydrolase family 65 protein [Alphaproteobacteria bacterium]